MNKKTLVGILLLSPLALLAQTKSDPIKTAELQSVDTSKSGFTIAGNIKGLDDGFIYLRYRKKGYDKNDPIIIDSTLVKEGRFAFNGNVQVPV